MKLIHCSSVPAVFSDTRWSRLDWVEKFHIPTGERRQLFAGVWDQFVPVISHLYKCNFETETRVPCRGIRGVKSKVLHKEVVDNFKMNKLQEQLQELDTSLPIVCHRAAIGVSTPANDPDMPVCSLSNPYQKPQKKCILCTHNVELDYRNTRLLSQFVSPHTGQIYGRHITGLCLFMQKRISKLIKRSQYFGFMPYVHKDPRFLHDPRLFDPFQRKS